MIDLKGNLFTFGCSMTSYSWPTWADILGRECQNFENWGRVGAGNLYIFESIIECLTSRKITAQDTVIILWSTTSRMDYYQLGTWSAIHNRTILDNKDTLVNCPDGNEIISYSYFTAIDEILTAKKINFYMFSWVDYDSRSKAGKLHQKTLSKIIKVPFKIKAKKILKPAEGSIKEVYDRLSGADWPPFEKIFHYDRNKFASSINTEIDEKFYKYLEDNKKLFYSDEVIDYHPLPSEHLDTILKFTPISKNTKDWVFKIDGLLRKNLPINFDKNQPERL